MSATRRGRREAERRPLPPCWLEAQLPYSSVLFDFLAHTYTKYSATYTVYLSHAASRCCAARVDGRKTHARLASPRACAPYSTIYGAAPCFPPLPALAARSLSSLRSLSPYATRSTRVNIYFAGDVDWLGGVE